VGEEGDERRREVDGNRMDDTLALEGMARALSATGTPEPDLRSVSGD